MVTGKDTTKNDLRRGISSLGDSSRPTLPVIYKYTAIRVQGPLFDLIKVRNSVAFCPRKVSDSDY